MKSSRIDLAVQPFAFDRPFELMTYTRGHGRLNFRSYSENLTPRRIEVGFVGVHAFKLKTLYDGLRIECTGLDWLEKFEHGKSAYDDGLKVYNFLSQDWEGYVVALNGFFQWDDQELSAEPLASPLDSEFHGYIYDIVDRVDKSVKI